DGRYVGFESMTNNLVSDDSDDNWDYFVHDLLTGQTTLVSAAVDGVELSITQEQLSGDGRYVVFLSVESHNVYVHDRLTGQTSLVSVASDGGWADASSDIAQISADGRFVAFISEASNLVPDDTNAAWDVF